MRSALVRLYPAAWRDRYGDEFEAMLSEQPTNLGTVADVVLGAVDAHLTSKSPENRGSWLRRLPGLLLTLGALVWTAGQGLNVGRPWDQQNSLASEVALAGMVLVGFASLAESSFRRGGSKLRRILGALPAAALLTTAAIELMVWWGLTWLPRWVEPFLWLSIVVVFGAFFAQLGWAAAMAVKAPEHRLAMTALSIALVLNLTVGHLVWTSSGVEPMYPPDIDRFLQWLWPAAWTVIGLSVLRLRRSGSRTIAAG